MGVWVTHWKTNVWRWWTWTLLIVTKLLDFSANDFSGFSSFVVLRIKARVSGILARCCTIGLHSSAPRLFFLRDVILETCHWILGSGDQSEVFRFEGGYPNPLSHRANPAVLFLTPLVPLDVTRLKQLATEVSAPCAQCFQRLLLETYSPKHLDFF